ncbi:MAG TPA: response regulator [Terriglobales bacterium]|nr:response regulator [Terriglobales bacterium]
MRILVAEDDKTLLELTGAILAQSAQVDCASIPAQALRLMAAETYDLLVTDLNMQGGGDGLMLSGAMRSLHPRARNVLITGYPDFARALQAMQSTLDLVIVKPVGVDQLRSLPQLAESAAAKASHETGKHNLWSLLDNRRTAILSAWLKLVQADDVIGSLSLSASERLDHIEAILHDLTRDIPAPPSHAEAHGRERRAQHYKAEWIAREVSFLRRVIFDAVVSALLELDLSRLTADLFEMNWRLDAALLTSLRTFGLLTD